VKQPLQLETMETALWHCTSCQIWWGNGPKTDEAAALMQQAANHEPILAWDEFRGWRVDGALGTAVACPNCGKSATRLAPSRTSRPAARSAHQHPVLEAS
jgi:hypothetical protein